MNQTFLFLKKNFSWLLVLLLFLLLALAYLKPRPMFTQVMPSQGSFSYDAYDTTESAPMMKAGQAGLSTRMSGSAAAPAAMPVNQQRMVSRDTYLSLVVSNVTQVVSDIEQKAQALGGYLVMTNVSTPEEGGTGSITVRVPSDKRGEALDAFKGMAVNVVSEQVDGQDITDAYQDIKEQLAILEQTKTKLEGLLATATRVQDILEVQRELTNVQQQIDFLKGQEEYLRQSAELTKITVYVSTDELALPYSPDQPWRPQVIFKLAVRALVMVLRSIVNVAIWVIVFAPIWLAVLGILYLLNRRLRP